jgi:hypothetical protein
MMYGSTMFGKLWEWIMGIIAWIMSKFTRINVTADVNPAEVEQVAPAAEENDAPPPAENNSSGTTPV